MVCRNCGGTMEGDGVTLVLHCEHIDAPSVAPDEGPIYCEGNPREAGDDDGIEYADPRDYRESR